MPTKFTLRTRERGQGLWLVPLFLVLGIVCPTACVLWFMNDAAESQALSARQSVLEAYRGQLRLIRDQVDAYWESRAAQLDTQMGHGTPQDFARMVKGGIAASVVLLRPDGSLVYPSVSAASFADPRQSVEIGGRHTRWRNNKTGPRRRRLTHGSRSSIPMFRWRRGLHKRRSAVPYTRRKRLPCGRFSNISRREGL